VENLIDGRAIAEQIHAETSQRVAALKSRGIAPKLIFVRVGEDPASKVYVGMKERTSARVGILSETQVLPETTSEKELLTILDRLNRDSSVHGILVQAPLPKHISETKIYSTVSPEKDVDGFHPVNVGKLMLGDTTGFLPCTPAGVHELLIRSQIKIEGAEVVVLGRGNIVGKPMAAILMQRGKNANATVTICHSQTRDIREHCRRADIIIAAIGVVEFVKADMVKPGATVIDVGVNRIQDASAKVGPMTIAMLLQNTVRAAELATK
jgi:methylenetetrahydrofolate dehydrogenase (NADP+)/methenyltetrahydrofolate cyclohydrolase